MHVSVYESVCDIPYTRQIIWSAAFKQKASGSVYSHGKSTFSQERKNETMQPVGLWKAHSTTLLYGERRAGGGVKVVN